MASSSKDWILGQKLVAQGICTLDQVREALGESRPLAEALLDRGVPAEKLRSAGLDVPDRPAAPARAPLAELKPSRAPWVLVVLALLAVGAWGLLRKPEETKIVEADPDRAPR